MNFAQGKGSIELQNLQDDKKVFRDTLHHQAVEIQPCVQTICQGSKYKCKTNTTSLKKRSKEDILNEASKFLREYYASTPGAGALDYSSRLAEVRKSFETTDTYDLLEEELEYGVKMAWRNASRCIGRIQWSNIKLFDCRHVKTTKGMFKAMINHMKYATNEGNIRSAITIFPHCTDPKQAYRVWSPQFIKYAGYKNPDGTITGDPGAIEFTDVCLSMGWRGKGTDFDILPWVLQANGEDPEYFDIPPEVILEVSLKHPKYPWFEELGLKWYAVPGVSNMSLDCGGLEFSAAPFNGWYMSSEVGRDLLDHNRYNKSLVIANKMGLNTETTSSLWIDQVVVETNIAILHSFQEQRVTISEHHATAASFIQFMESEFRTRGGCPTDWIWVNPPLASSMTPLFHQEMLNYKLKPCYDYMVDPWRTHKWTKDEYGQHRTLHSSKSLLGGAIKCVFLSNSLMTEARSKRVRCTVLFATETGRSERFAYELAVKLDAIFQPRVIRMDKYDISTLKDEKLLFTVASTFGEGEPPANGVQFLTSLHELQLLSHAGSGESLKHIKYASFGLGSRAYPKFCAFAHDIDRALEDLGLKRCYPLGEGDQLKGQENSFEKWSRGVFKASCNAMKLQLEETDAPSISSIGSQVRLISTMEQAVEINADRVYSALGKIHDKKLIEFKVTGNENLQAPESERKTKLVKLSTEDKQLSYEPGDHVAIFPTNDVGMVKKIINKVSLGNLSQDDVVKVEVLRQNRWISDNRLPPTSVRMALTYLLDISSPPDQMLLDTFAHLATDEEEKKKLNELSHDTKKYNEWSTGLYQPLDEFLEEYPSVNVPVALLLHQLPLLQPRYYSISSSLLSHPGEIHVTVAVVIFNAGTEGKGPRRSGVCSTWLDSRQCGDKVPLFHRSVENFRLPSNKGLPIILIGPGTGIAPFLSFLDQRRGEMSESSNNKDDYGDVTLYFGCRRSDHDQIYKDEMRSLVDVGVITKYRVALSREPGVPKTYVQDLLLNDAEDVYHQVVKMDGHIYICGDIVMASRVEAVIKLIFCQVGKMSVMESDRYVQTLCDLDRYHKDIYGFKVERT